MQKHRQFALMVAVVSSCIGCWNSNNEVTQDNTTELNVIASLPKEQSEYLWDLEHHGNILVQVGLQQLADALRDDDRAKATSLLSQDFVGSDLETSSEATISDDAVSGYRKRRNDRSTNISLGRQEFVGLLFDLRASIDAQFKCRFGIKSLAPIDKDDLSGNWTALCQMRMTGLSSDSHPVETTLLLQLVTAAPKALLSRKD